MLFQNMCSLVSLVPACSMSFEFIHGAYSLKIKGIILPNPLQRILKGFGFSNLNWKDRLFGHLDTKILQLPDSYGN